MQERPAQPYAAITGEVQMDEVGVMGDRLPELFACLDQVGVPPAGPVFFRYTRFGPGRTLRMEAGVPVAAPVPASDQLVAGTLPGGLFVTATHHGHPDGLKDATHALLVWAEEQGLRFDTTQSRTGEWWGCRLEWYLTDPEEQPDMAKWETELAIRLAD